jgi:hypothetical protein
MMSVKEKRACCPHPDPLFVVPVFFKNNRAATVRERVGGGIMDEVE